MNSLNRTTLTSWSTATTVQIMNIKLIFVATATNFFIVHSVKIDHDMQLRSQTMNTVGLAASIAGTYMHWRSYTSIMLCYTYTRTVYIYYVCISVKGALTRTSNQHFNYARIIPSITLQKILRMSIHIWQWVVSNRSGSSEVTYECGRMSHVSFSGIISMLVPDILQIPSGCTALTAPLWLRGWWYEKMKKKEEAEVVDEEENIPRRMERMGKWKHWRWRQGGEKRLTEWQKRVKEKRGVKDVEKRRKQEEGGVKRLRWRGEREREKKEIDDEKGIMALS